VEPDAGRLARPDLGRDLMGNHGPTLLRENLNINGQLKNRSQKLSKNIRPFIKRDYIKRDNNMNGAPLTGTQNENRFLKTFKKNIINFRRHFIILNNGYEEPSIYISNNLSPLVRNNFYWALNRTEKEINSNSNYSYIRNVWEKYKIRELNKNNKTNKMSRGSAIFNGAPPGLIFNLFKKYYDGAISPSANVRSSALFIDKNLLDAAHVVGSANPYKNELIADQEGRGGDNTVFPHDLTHNYFSESNINNFLNASQKFRRNSTISNNQTDLSTLNIRSLEYLEKQRSSANSDSLDFIDMASINNKKNLLATNKYTNRGYTPKTYLDKTEKKLINIETKLKLLGLSSTQFIKPSFIYRQNLSKLENSRASRVYSTRKLLKYQTYNKQLIKHGLSLDIESLHLPSRVSGQNYQHNSVYNSSNASNYRVSKVKRAFSKKKESLNKRARITPLNYNKIYFRFLKQELLKENMFFYPYNIKQFAANIKEAGSAKSSLNNLYIPKLQKIFYNIKQQTLSDIVSTQHNLSGIKISNKLQNYQKFSSTTYWWTKFKISGASNFLSDSTHVKQSFNAAITKDKATPLIPFLYATLHFCTLMTLISLGGVRSVIKFYYILLSKIYKILQPAKWAPLNKIRFTNFFPRKVQKSSFNVSSYMDPHNSSSKSGKLTLETKQYMQPTSFILAPHQKNNNILTNKISLLSRSSFLSLSGAYFVGCIKNVDLLTTFKTIKLISLKYLISSNIDINSGGAEPVPPHTLSYQQRLYNGRDLLRNPQKRNSSHRGHFLILGKAIGELKKAVSLRLTTSPSWVDRPRPRIGSFLSANQYKEKNADNINIVSRAERGIKTERKKQPYSLINGAPITMGLWEIRQAPLFFNGASFNDYLKKRPVGTNTTTNNKVGSKNLDRIKVKVLYNYPNELIAHSNKKLSMGLNLMYKTSFYTYLLLLKSVDLLVAPAFLIYKFFEKPGEYVVENLAYSFLLEWSADLVTTIPDSMDPAVANYFSKLQRNLPFYMFLNAKIFNNMSWLFWPLFGFIREVPLKMADHPSKNNSDSNLIKTGLTTVINSIETIFGIVVLGINNSIIRRFTNSSILLFTQQLAEPDLDYIYRQKKGIIFWDLWGESLKTIAEKNSVNIYELSTDKEEQLKLLSNMQNLKNLNGGTRSVQLANNFTKKISGASLNSPFGFSSVFTRYLTATSHHTPSHAAHGESNNEVPLWSLAKSRAPVGWAVNQFLNDQGKDTDLFIDLHPPKSFSNTATSLKYAFSIQAPIGSIVCQIFGGIFYKQISKNILVVLHKSSNGLGNAAPNNMSSSARFGQTLEKSLLIQAIAGETELKIITDNAHRYAMVVQGVAVGIKLLKDVFEALCATGPCLFLLEDIHAIGERRPFLIDEAAPNLTESIYNKNQSMQSFLLKEKSSASREILYKTNKHLLTNYKKPYKEFKSLASNHFSFTFLYRAANLTKLRTNDINTSEVPLSIQVGQKDNGGASAQVTNLDKKTNFDDANSKNTSKSKVYGSFSQLIKSIKNKQSLINPPASSPFNLLLMKESTKMKPNQSVKEMAWFGLPGEQYSLISKYNYSIRVKVALLADSVLSNLSVKLEMITDLLVIIDSVKGNRGFIIFATTHLPDILDPALRRPGRFDETLSLPFIPSLYSRWTNYRYNVQYLTSSLFKQYSIPLNSTFNKGSTLDFSKYPACYNDSQFEALLPIYSSMVGRQKQFLATERSSDINGGAPTSSAQNWSHNANLIRMARLQNIEKNLINGASIYQQTIGNTTNQSSQSEAALQNEQCIYRTLFDRRETLARRGLYFDINHSSEQYQLQTSSRVVSNEKSLLNIAVHEVSSNKKEPHAASYLIKNLLQFSYSRATSYASNSIMSLMIYSSLDWPHKNEQKLRHFYLNFANNQIFLKWPSMLKEFHLNNNNLENYSNYLSLFGPNKNERKLRQRNSANFNNNSIGMPLKYDVRGGNQSTHPAKLDSDMQNTSLGQILLTSFITYKFGETFGIPSNLKNQYTLRTRFLDSKKPSALLTSNGQSNKNTLAPIFSKRNLSSNYKKHSDIINQNPLQPFIKKSAHIKMNGTSLLVNFNNNSHWKKGASLLYSYIQKRLPHEVGSQKRNAHANLNFSTFYTNQLLNFNNKYSLMEPPSPPISNILLPAKRYENYRRSFKNFYNLNLDTDIISEKLKLHQQQRLLKRLYNYPIKEFFRNEKFAWCNSHSTSKTNDRIKMPYSANQRTTRVDIAKFYNNNVAHEVGSAQTSAAFTREKINFTQSYFTFAGIENFIQKKMASLNQFTYIDYSYRNILYNRHKTYLTNQWWNGHQGEHNLESTFLSDIDWRYTQIRNTLSNVRSTPDDIQVDFPDCEQYYNPRNRRWILTKGDWNSWFNINADLNKIYSHYIYESLTKAYKYIDQNREVLDFYSAKLLSTSFNLLTVIENNASSPYTKQNMLKTNVAFIKEVGSDTNADLHQRDILTLYKRFFYKISDQNQVTTKT
jgi:hypothetical protein